MRNPDWMQVRRTRVRLARLRDKCESGAMLSKAEYFLAELNGLLPPEYGGTTYDEYEMAAALAKRRPDESNNLNGDAVGEPEGAADVDLVFRPGMPSVRQ